MGQLRPRRGGRSRRSPRQPRRWLADPLQQPRHLSARSADLPEGVCGRSGAIGVGIFPGGLVSCLWASMPCFRERRFERKNRVAAPSVAPIDRHDQCQERHVMELENKRSEEHTSELQSLMRISYAVFCLKKQTQRTILYNKKN